MSFGMQQPPQQQQQPVNPYYSKREMLAQGKRTEVDRVENLQAAIDALLK